MKLPLFVRSLSLGYLVLILIGFWGCAGKPFTPPEPNEIPEGPGLFTKEEGKVVLSVDLNEGAPPSRPEAESSDSPDAKTMTTPVEDPDYEEFLQWQEWKKYQDWKRKESPDE